MSKNLIKKLEESLLLAEVRNSKEKLELLLHDDFLEYGKSGRVYTKHLTIEALTKEKNESKIKLFDFELKELSEGAVLALYKTKSLNQITLRSSIWKKHSQYGWQLFFHQGTLKE